MLSVHTLVRIDQQCTYSGERGKCGTTKGVEGWDIGQGSYNIYMVRAHTCGRLSMASSESSL